MSQEACGTSPTTCVEQPRPETVHHVQPIQLTPRADVWEAEDAFVLTVEMPGVSEADADLTIERNVLTVRGVARTQISDGLKPALGDCRPRQFERSFRLSDAIDGQHLDATARDGILTIRMPKAQHAVARKIAVRPA